LLLLLLLLLLLWSKARCLQCGCGLLHADAPEFLQNHVSTWMSIIGKGRQRHRFARICRIVLTYNALRRVVSTDVEHPAADVRVSTSPQEAAEALGVRGDFRSPRLIETFLLPVRVDTHARCAARSVRSLGRLCTIAVRVT